MKNIIFFLTFILIAPEVSAQCNNLYYQLKEGTVITMESYDKKDKMQSRSETTVTKYENTANGYIATISYKIYDNKEKVISEGEYAMECEDGVVKIDMSGIVPAESMTAFQDMEFEVEMDQLQYPANMSTGQTLEDASIKISAQSGPIPMNMIFDITDRKVEGKESITTPAGTFDCYKISYNTHSKMMVANMNFTNIEYLSEGSGVVKTETYKSNGNLVSYTLLAKYEY